MPETGSFISHSSSSDKKFLSRNILSIQVKMVNGVWERQDDIMGCAITGKYSTMGWCDVAQSELQQSYCYHS